MAKAKEIVLPKLPRGMGSYSWNNESHTLIKYRKVINYKNEKKTISVYGKTVSEVNSDMKEKEEEFRRSVDLNITQIKTETLEEGINCWLNLYKTEELKGKSYDRVESKFLQPNTYIVDIIQSMPFTHKLIIYMPYIYIISSTD